jgi:hypothetical protein
VVSENQKQTKEFLNIIFQTTMAQIVNQVKEGIKPVVKFGMGALGAGGGFFLLKKIDGLLPDSTPALVRNVVPGLATMIGAGVLAVKTNNDKLKAAAFGIGIGGAADVLTKVLGSSLPDIKKFIPSVSGLGRLGAISQYNRAVNTGDFPPSYYERNAFQGFAGDGYALSGGVPMNGSPYALSGEGVPMNGASPYALS